MRIQITSGPSYAISYVHLQMGEQLVAEADAMAALSDGVEASAGVGSGGVVSAAMRKFLGGETFFVGVYTARVHGAWVAVNPPLPGDMTWVTVSSDYGLALTSGAYVASSIDVDIDTRWAGFRNVALREGATLLHATGSGACLFASYGGLQKFQLDAGQSMIIDAGHLVAWQDTLNIEVGMLGGLAKAAVSGEWLVARVTGPGDVWMQTRKEQQLEGLLLPSRKQNTYPRRGVT